MLLSQSHARIKQTIARTFIPAITRYRILFSHFLLRKTTCLLLFLHTRIHTPAQSYSTRSWANTRLARRQFVAGRISLVRMLSSFRSSNTRNAIGRQKEEMLAKRRRKIRDLKPCFVVLVPGPCSSASMVNCNCVVRKIGQTLGVRVTCLVCNLYLMCFLIG